jgi:AcrR family transcriptional regulator
MTCLHAREVEEAKRKTCWADVRERLLDAAEELFSENGFRATSIRDITKAAKCNISTVNYYFHTKEKLYVEVFHRRMRILAQQRSRRIRQELSQDRAVTSLESLIRSFAEVFLEPFLNDGGGRRFMRLMMHESQNPNLPKGLFLNQVIKPVRNIMRQALIMVCPTLNRVEADFCLHSIVAQLLNVIQAQELFKELDKKEMPLLDLKKSIEHVVRFSVGGVRQYLDCEGR